MIRAYRSADLEAVVRCFNRSVRTLGAPHYDSAQILAWAPEPPDLAAWARRLDTGGVFVDERDGDLAGFVRIDDTGLVDLLYVHPNHARRGVARDLLETARTWAVDQGARHLESSVSIAARPFFEAMGFRALREQMVERGGASLRNFRMARAIDPRGGNGIDVEASP